MKRSLLASGILGLVLLAGPASAQNRREWNREHPRRHEVNERLNRQAARTAAGARKGQLTPAEAGRIRAEDQAIRAQERGMAAEHGGHITKGEQWKLNREENRVSRQIRRERHDGK